MIRNIPKALQSCILLQIQFFQINISLPRLNIWLPPNGKLMLCYLICKPCPLAKGRGCSPLTWCTGSRFKSLAPPLQRSSASQAMEAPCLKPWRGPNNCLKQLQIFSFREGWINKTGQPPVTEAIDHWSIGFLRWRFGTSLSSRARLNGDGMDWVGGSSTYIPNMCWITDLGGRLPTRSYVLLNQIS